MPNISEIRCKQACSKVGKRSPNEWNLNLYRGCMHRCIYCFAIYSHKYLQDDDNYFDNIYVKVNIAEQLDRQLSSPSWTGAEIGISGVTDCYQPLEAKYKLMPEILKVLIKHKNPCSITTKSDLILRDYDLIDELSRVTHVSINASISCMDNEIRKKIEPGAKNASAKFQMLKEFSKTNATTGMLQMPIIPHITDSRENIEQLYANAADSKVDYIVPGVLYLRGKTKGTFFDGIRREFPELLSPLQQLYLHGGAGKAYKDSLYHMVKQIKRKYRLSSDYMKVQREREKAKKIPEGPKQLSLFDVSLPESYQSSQVPNRDQLNENKAHQNAAELNSKVIDEFNLDPFVEIEMGQTKPANNAVSIPSPQPMQPIDSITDETRALFYSMRQIARNTMNFQTDHAKIFYDQALFMIDFEDNYTKSIQFSSYFPYYQRMSYEQLRTYFTWRTKVRSGIITATSTSYAFLYIYELLNQIGVATPEEGLDELMVFWQGFRVHDPTIDQYVIQWLKDYHIYYPLPHAFRDFVDEHQLMMNYPTIFGYETGEEDSFDLYASISKYNIKESVFYGDDSQDMISQCFHWILSRIRELFKNDGKCFEDLIFQPIERIMRWIPFNQALFHPILKQSDRQVALSKREVYQCENNRWTFKSAILSEEGKQLIGYMMKEMESSLRKLTKFKYKISANPNTSGEKNRAKLEKIGIIFPHFIEQCVEEFHVESTRIEVSVDVTNLGQIRQEALQTQEKLIVPEAEEVIGREEVLETQEETLEQEVTNAEITPPLDTWQALKESLTKIELEALNMILAGANIKKFAAENSVMLEVLVDEINQKAIDFVGDAILELDWDESIVVYEEYQESLVELMEMREF